MKEVVLVVRMDRRMHEQLKSLASTHRVSQAGMVRKLIARAAEKQSEAGRVTAGQNHEPEL